MTGKEKELKQWPDPKDFGLPVVEIAPLKTKAASKAQEASSSVPIDVKQVRKNTVDAMAAKAAASEQPKSPEFKVEEKKSSNSWIWIAAAVAIATVLVIVWQMNKPSETIESTEVLTASAVEPAVEPENESTSVNSISSEESQGVSNQDSISNSTSSPNVVAETPQTGTTIDHNVSESLVRITEKASRPYFYIIVGSLPNEELAIKEAAQYMDRAETLYLIMPYEDVPHYRLAIAGSIGFTAMKEELARVKDQYTEDLWILKY
ncbi:hypothetical protein PBT90_10310 [Algoriphagus halophytocola]|uniref:SPOR domain-containing protein n=1 Tax=Algoriphagus halophytocola TaxID=2991499 RepID=A0ABY6MJ14_9BACT|nr:MULTISPECIES: hypothetical protein [unclassified Algoriphagus]UZD23781.1 hypothetical protein OM944_04640 [Algoriphagus sp. TR-M5]WBL45075.1 hypothetical protein PBT90_10310 [Algoriphagus sp. TR-M9]